MDKPFKKKIILLILLILFLGFSGILQDTKVQAAAYSNVSNFKLSLPPTPPITPIIPGTPVIDVSSNIQETQTRWEKFIKWFQKSAIGTAFKQGAKVFLSQIAYDTATYIATGGRGQTPMFESDNINSYLSKAGDVALGQFMDDLAQDWTDFDICNPAGINGPSVKLNIHQTLFKDNKKTEDKSKDKPKKRCTWSEIQNDWGKWVRDISDNPGKFTSGIKAYFTPEENDLGIYLTLETNLLEKKEKARVNAALERTINKGLKDLTSPITRTIKTPSALLGNRYKSVDEKTGEVELTYTGEIIDSFLSTFTNTLMAKWMDQLFKKGFDSGNRVTSFATIIAAGRTYSPVKDLQFAKLAEVSFTPSEENVIDKLVLPSANPLNNIGPTSEVITSRMAGAIKAKKTLAQALVDGDIDGSATFGFNSDKKSQPNYKTGYPYRSLVILRTQRIIPVGWELAAQYYSLYGQSSRAINLDYLIHCFEDKDNPDDAHYPLDCREDTNGNGLTPEQEDLIEPSDLDENFVYDFNPYYHLVDPNWVLKSPETYCSKQGAGSELYQDNLLCLEDNVAETKINSTLVSTPYCKSDAENPDKAVRQVSRATDYCGDWQSCLIEDDQGNCQAMGYCVEEKPIWRFEGEKCSDYYNSCETSTNVTSGETVSYLRDTMLSCQQNEVGCLWYSTSKDLEGNWSKADSDRIYLNQEVNSCQASNAGCTELVSLRQGINLIENGNFAYSSLSGWQEPIDCQFNAQNGVLEVSSDAGTTCELITNGYVPIDPTFTYQLSYKIKTDEAITITGTSLNYYSAYADGSPGVSVDSIDFIESDIVLNQSDQYTTYSYQIGPESDNSIPVNTKFLAVNFDIDNLAGNKYYLDDIQLIITKSPIVKDNISSLDLDTYRSSYSDSSIYSTYLKVQPDYLDCDTDDCDKYVNYCTQEEVGCQGYTPLGGGLEVPAKTDSDNLCNKECVGYSSFLELGTFFNKIENPSFEESFQYFIPASGESCSAQYLGCEQFTNLDEVAKGGEGIEYFSYLRQCVSEANPDISVYYTWEGSDTTGYQLKKWELLKNNINAGPCTHLNLNSDNTNQTCDDTAETIEGWLNYCPPGNLNCREFITSSGNNFYIDQRYVITASSQCHPYRRTATGQIFNSDPAEGISCPANQNQCKEYKGNSGNNIFNVFEADFEDGDREGFLNTDNDYLSVINTNDSVYMGEHALTVLVSNNSIIKTLDNTVFEPGKQYELIFWARSGDVSLKEEINNTDYSNYVNFVINDLNLNWQEYRIGPIQVNSNVENPTIRIAVNNLGITERFIIDNITLQEYTDKFFMIKDSWNTPLSCDTPQLGAQLGCQAYTDRGQDIHYLKSFSYICSENSIGCQAFIHTQDSSTQKEETYLAWCDNYIGEIEDNICKIRGVEKCTISEGQTSCSYENMRVKNDQIEYIVNDPSKACSEKGCSLMGVPNLNRQNEYFEGTDYELYLDEYITGFSDTYLINDPDKYPRQLCSESALYCTEFVGEITSNYYYDPQALANNEGEANDRTCTYDPNQAKWVKTGTSELCSATKFMPMVGQEEYQGWVGRCEASASTCTEYRDPEKPTLEGVEQCDSLISPQMRGLCGDDEDEIIDNNNYCRKNINGVDHYVCEVLANQPCPYTENDWTCIISGGNSEGQYCQINGKDVCYAPGDSSSCTYSLACQSYYTKANTIVTCDNGVVDRDAGCILFNDTSQSQVFINSFSSIDGKSPVAINECSFNFSESDYCNANTQTPLKVTKDRECAESLYCTSSVEVNNNQVCLDIGRCLEINLDDPSSCLKIENNIGYQEQTYDFLNSEGQPSGIDLISNLSGYSKAGLRWSEDKVINGYYPPEQMMESGRPVNISNQSFEMVNKAFEPVNWDLQEADGCAWDIETTTNNVYDGKYSLKINLRLIPDSETDECLVENSEYLSIKPGLVYNLSFFAKSNDGSQKAKIGFKWFDSAKISINTEGKFLLNINDLNWQRYTITFGPLGSGAQVVIPTDVSYGRLMLNGPTLAENGGIGSIWFDNVTIEPVLLKSESELAVKDCRLYPEQNSSSCEYTDLEVYKGWSGYCLEYDPANPVSCLQWYPVDNIYGDSLASFGEVADYYTGPAPLYYCLQSKSNYKENPEGGYHYEQCRGYTTTSCGYNGFIWTTVIVTAFADTYEELDSQTQRIIKFFSNGSNEEIWGITQADIEKVEVRTLHNGGDGSFPGISSVYPLANYNVSENSIYFSWCQGQGGPTETWNNSDGGCVGGDGSSERVGVKLDFDPQGNLEKIIHYAHDNDGYGLFGSNQDKWGYQLIFHLKEICSYLAQAVKEPGEGGQSEKIWSQRYNFSWTPNEGNVMGYKKQNMVDGSYLYGSVIDVSPGSPSDWSYTELQAPLNIHYGSQSTSGLDANVFAQGGLPLSTSNDYLISERKCLGGAKAGQDCQNSSDCEDSDNVSNGICIGVGKFCYNSQGMSDGVPCFSNDGCSNDYDECREPDLNSVSLCHVYNNINSGTNNVFCSSDEDCLPFSINEYPTCSIDEITIDYSNNYYCQNSTGELDPDIIECNAGEDGGNEICVNSNYPNCDIGTSIIDHFCVNNDQESSGNTCDDDNDCQITLYPFCIFQDELTLQNVLTHRLLNLFAEVYGVYEWQNGHYQDVSEDYFLSNYVLGNIGDTYPQVTNIKLNNQTNDIVLTAPGSFVNLSFNSIVDPNHLPINEIQVNWRDSLNQSDVQSFSGPLNSRANEAKPHEITHFYSCKTNAEGDRCSQCWDNDANDWVNAVDGECTYPGPSISIKDHWELCSENTLAEGTSCEFNDDSSYSFTNSIIIRP